MDFRLTGEQRSLQEMCRDFAAREIRDDAAAWSENEHFPTDTFQKMGDLGLCGMLVPDDYGGSDAGMVSYVAAMEEIGAGDQSLAAAWNAHSTIASLPILRFGTEDQKQRWLRPLATGERIGAFALTEPAAGSDGAAIRTLAQRADGGWRINGTKMFISNAGTDISLGVSLLARTTRPRDDSRRYGIFFVPDGTPGYTKGERLRKLGWHGMDTRELVFEDCWVPEDHLIGDDDHGLRSFLSVLDAGRVSVAALSLSLASTALDLAQTHARDREQFGAPIGSFQAIAHKLADMATGVEAARWLVYRAAWLADQGHSFTTAAAMAKLYASELANRVASDSLQIHGGYGWMRESAISRLYADAKILEIGEGTNEIQRSVIARSIFSRPDNPDPSMRLAGSRP